MSKDVPPSGEERGAGPPAPAAEPAPAGLLDELKRRGVVRAVVGYGVAAFAVLQVTEPILRGLHLPEGWLTPVVVLLGLGFPVTAALSWAFDLTIRGLVRTADAAPAALGAARSPWLAQAVVVVLATALGAVLAWLALRTPAPVADADGRISVAVADFANETRDPDLDGLSGLLITSLEQSRKLRVVTRARMIDLTRQLGKEAAERIDEALAREVGRKAGVRALLVASIRKLGEAYTAELKALDPQRDEYLFTLREQARSKDEILPLIDRLSEAVRLRLRERTEEVRASDIQVSQAITPSLEAYRHYFKGKEAAAKFDSEGALAAFREAVRLEPRFALAHYEIAFGGFTLASREKHAIADAVRNARYAPEKEAGMIRTLDAFLASRFAEAREGAGRLLLRFPDDVDVAWLGALVWYFEGDFEAELGLVEAVLRRRPDDHFLRMELVTLTQYLGRAQVGLTAALEASARERSPVTLTVLGLARAVAGDLDGAIADLDGAPEFPIGVWYRAQALAAAGRFDQALGPLAQVDDYFVGYVRAVALGFAGRRREGRATLEQMARLEAADPEQCRSLLAAYLAAAGDLPGSSAAWPGRDLAPVVDVLRHYEAGDDAGLAAIQPAFAPGSMGAGVAAALLDARRGRRPEALSALRALDRPAGWFVPYYRGMLAAGDGLHEEAVEALRRFEPAMLGWGDALFFPWLQARARLQLARSLDALGRREEGRRYVELQLSRWKRADPDLPLLAEARAVCKQLGCKAP